MSFFRARMAACLSSTYILCLFSEISEMYNSIHIIGFDSYLLNPKNLLRLGFQHRYTNEYRIA